MFKSSHLSPADIHVLCEAADVADAQMRLAEQVKKGTGALRPRLLSLANPAFLINGGLVVAASALLIGAWA